MLFDLASGGSESLRGDGRHLGSQGSGEPYEDVVQVSPQYHLRFRIFKAVAVVRYQGRDQDLPEALNRAAEGDREEEGRQHIPLLDPQSRLEHRPLAASAQEDEARGSPQEGFGHRKERRGVLLESLQDRSASNAGESILHIQLHPRVVGPRRRDNLHRVQESFGSSWAPRPVLLPPHRIQQ